MHGETIRLARTASTPLRGGGFYLPHRSGGFISYRNADALVLLSPSLVELASFALPADAIGAHSVNTAATLAAVSCAERVAFVGRGGETVFEIAHTAWGRGGSASGSAIFSPDDGDVWATVPTPEGTDTWAVIDVTERRLIAMHELGCRGEGSLAVADGGWMGLAVGEGQEGARSYVARTAGGTVEEVFDRGVLLAAVVADRGVLVGVPYGTEARSVILEQPGGMGRLELLGQLGADAEFEPVAGLLAPRVLAVGVLGGEPAFGVIDLDRPSEVALIRWPDLHPRRVRAVNAPHLLTTSALGDLECWRASEL